MKYITPSEFVKRMALPGWEREWYSAGGRYGIIKKTASFTESEKINKPRRIYALVSLEDNALRGHKLLETALALRHGKTYKSDLNGWKTQARELEKTK